MAWDDYTDSSMWGGGGDWFNPPPMDYSFQVPEIPAAQNSWLSNFQMPSWMNAQNIFGGLGGAASLGGALAGIGQGGNHMSNFQKAGMNSANAQLANYAQGKSPFQQMQMDLLKNIAGGQGLPAGYAKNIEQAFQPQMGDLYTQAAEMGRARGFHDAPASSPVGNQAMGIGLSNLQGQIAAQKLAQMMGLPGLFNAPIATGLQAAQSQGNMFMNLPHQQSGPGMGQVLGQGLGGALTGLGQGFGQQEQQTAQRDFQNQFLQALRQQGASQQASGGRGGSGFQFDSYVPQYQLPNPRGFSDPMGGY